MKYSAVTAIFGKPDSDLSMMPPTRHVLVQIVEYFDGANMLVLRFDGGSLSYSDWASGPVITRLKLRR